MFAITISSQPLNMFTINMDIFMIFQSTKQGTKVVETSNILFAINTFIIHSTISNIIKVVEPNILVLDAIFIPNSLIVAEDNFLPE